MYTTRFPVAPCQIHTPPSSLQAMDAYLPHNHNCVLESSPSHVFIVPGVKSISPPDTTLAKQVAMSEVLQLSNCLPAAAAPWASSVAVVNLYIIGICVDTSVCFLQRDFILAKKIIIFFHPSCHRIVRRRSQLVKVLPVQSIFTFQTYNFEVYRKANNSKVGNSARGQPKRCIISLVV